MDTIGLFILGLGATLVSLFLMFLILIQRGKGGGLTGALGGAGGQSAFGSKAGDLFTRITIVTAIVWMTCCLLIIKIYNSPPASVVQDTTGEVTGADDDADGDTISTDGDFQKTLPEGEESGDDAAPGDETAPGGDDENADDPVISGADTDGSEDETTVEPDTETEGADSTNSGEGDDEGDKESTEGSDNG